MRGSLRLACKLFFSLGSHQLKTFLIYVKAAPDDKKQDMNLLRGEGMQTMDGLG